MRKNEKQKGQELEELGHPLLTPAARFICILSAAYGTNYSQPIVYIEILRSAKRWRLVHLPIVLSARKP